MARGKLVSAALLLALGKCGPPPLGGARPSGAAQPNPHPRPTLTGRPAPVSLGGELGSAADSFYSYQVSSNSVDDGTGLRSELSETSFDSRTDRQPRTRYEYRGSPSSNHFRSAGGPSYNERLAARQVATNSIGVGWVPPPPRQSQQLAFDEIANYFTKLQGEGQPVSAEPKQGLRRKPRNRFRSTARTVESPALAVDTGGQSSSIIADQFAKILNVQRGHYAGIYDQLDGLKPSTRAPAEVIEDSVRSAVQHIFASPSAGSAQPATR